MKFWERQFSAKVTLKYVFDIPLLINLFKRRIKQIDTAYQLAAPYLDPFQKSHQEEP